jgi:hypothetical protein
VINLRQWISAWYSHALAAGFIRPPFTMDDTIAGRLEGYFAAGLTPAEGANVIFGRVH